MSAKSANHNYEDMGGIQKETGERRQKLVHAKGIVGTVQFIPSENKETNPYTGIFEGGSDYGIVRMSESLFLASDPLADG